MKKKRNNESTDPDRYLAQRTNRGYEINGLWYFELRGGGQKGPYDSEEEMQADLNEFIQLHKQMNQQK